MSRRKGACGPVQLHIAVLSLSVCPLLFLRDRFYVIFSFIPDRSPRILESWFASRRSWFRKWEAIAGAVAGFSTSLISISLIRVLQQLKSCWPQICGVKMLTRFKQVSLFVAYFSFAGWLAIQYGKKLGLPDIFRVH